MRGRWALPLLAAVTVTAVSVGVYAVGTADDEPTKPGSAGAWTAMAPGPLSPRAAPVMAGWGDAVVVAGGRQELPCGPAASCAGDPRPTERDGAVYDVPSGTWTALPPAPLPLDAISNAVLDDVLYVLCNKPGSNRVDLVALDLRTRAWSTVPAPPIDGTYLRLTAAGDRLVAAPHEQPSASSRDAAWIPAQQRWELLPPSPFGRSYDRAMTWTGTALVLVTPGSPPGAEDTGPSFVQAAVLESDGWRELPESDLVIGGASHWAYAGGRVVSATTLAADGGEVNPFGRMLPSGGFLDPETGSWSALPTAPDVQRRFGLPHAASDRWVVEDGLVLDAVDERWHVLQPPPEVGEQGASAAWAAGRLVVWGGASGYTGGSTPAEFVDGGAVWTPPTD